MKLGVANRIYVTDADLDDTLECEPSYTDIVALVEANHPECDRLAQAYLDRKDG